MITHSKQPTDRESFLQFLLEHVHTTLKPAHLLFFSCTFHFIKKGILQDVRAVRNHDFRIGIRVSFGRFQPTQTSPKV